MNRSMMKSKRYSVDESLMVDNAIRIENLEIPPKPPTDDKSDRIRQKKYGLMWFYKAKKKQVSTSDEEDLSNKSVVRQAVRNFDSKKLHEFIISATFDLNEASVRGITALHEAAIDGNMTCLEMLVENGADISKPDKEGFTCLDYAVLGGHFDCATFLIENGANTKNIKDGPFTLRQTKSTHALYR